MPEYFCDTLENGLRVIEAFDDEHPLVREVADQMEADAREEA